MLNILVDAANATSVAFWSAIVSSIAALSTIMFAFWNFRRERVNQRISYLQAKQVYLRDLKLWAESAIHLLSESVHLCDLDPSRTSGESFFDRRHRILISLSAVIDRGRWFFPNVQMEGVGAHKPKAFQGYRHEVLDSLVDAYKALEAVNYLVSDETNKACRCRLDDDKRQFVSEVQGVLDPVNADKEFGRITKLVS